MSHCGLKSRHPDLLLDEENGKCSILKCCAEFLSIGNHSPKRKRTRSGLSDWRHSQSQWKLEQNIITGVVIVGMVAHEIDEKEKVLFMKGQYADRECPICQTMMAGIEKICSNCKNRYK